MNKPMIAVIQHPTLGAAVSGRELYPLITASRASRDIFPDWFRDNQRRLSLTEGTDFVVVKVPMPGRRNRHIEFIVSVAAAMKVAAAQVAGRGTAMYNYLSSGAWKAPADQQPATAPELTTEATKSKNGTQLHLTTDSPANRAESSQPAPAVDESPAAQLLRLAQELVSNEAANAERTTKPGRVDELESRLAIAEGKVDTLLFFFQQAAHALRAYSPHARAVDPVLSGAAIASATKRYGASQPTTPEPQQPTTRHKVDRLVKHYANAKEVNPQTVWNRLYGQLAIQFGFDAYALGFGQKDPNYLDITEKNGQIDNLFAIAEKVLTTSPTPVNQ